MRRLAIAASLLLLTVAPVRADDWAECRAGIARIKADIVKRPSPAALEELRRNLRRAERELGEREYDECAEIVRGGAERDDDDDDDDEEEGPETEDMFGFTQGTDVLEKGRFELSTEAEGAFGKRSGRYRFGAVSTTFGFAPVDRLSVELGAAANLFSIRNVPDLDDRSGGGFGGLSAELKYQIVKRGPASPFGLTLIAEPELGFRDEEGGRIRGAGVETRLALDTALVPNTLFAAVNLIYEAERARPRGVLLLNREGEEVEEPFALPCAVRGVEEDECIASAGRAPVERESQVGVSGALAFQAVPKLFLGAELRYLRAYGGLALNRFEGEALFVGPTLYAKLGESFSLSAAWSAQVAGRAAGTPGRLDLDNFTRHEAKVKLSYEF
jgi:hypothetical protein